MKTCYKPLRHAFCLLFYISIFIQIFMYGIFMWSEVVVDVLGCRNYFELILVSPNTLLMVLLWLKCLLSAFHLACCVLLCVSLFNKLCSCMFCPLLSVWSFNFPSTHNLCDLKCYTDMNLISVIPVGEEKCSHLLSQYALPVLRYDSRNEQFWSLTEIFSGCNIVGYEVTLIIYNVNIAWWDLTCITGMFLCVNM